MEEQFQILAALAPTAGYKGADEFLQTLKDEDGEFTVTPEEAAKQLDAKIRKASKKGRDDQRKRGTRELDDSVRKRISAKFGDLLEDVEAENALGVIDALHERIQDRLNAPKGSDNPSLEITEELLAANPIAKDYFRKEYGRKLEEDRKALKDRIADLDRKAKESEAATMRAALRTHVAKEANNLKVLLEMEGVEPGSRLDAMLDRSAFSVSNFRLVDGVPVPVDANGERLTDEMGHNIHLADIIKRNNVYGYSTMNQDKGSPGLKTAERKPSGGKLTFEDANDFADRYYKASKEDKPALKEAYEAQLANEKK